MDTLKFRYVVRYHGDKFRKFYLFLDEIQTRSGSWHDFNEFCEGLGHNNYEIVARDFFTGITCSKNTEIYEGDLVHVQYHNNEENDYIDEVYFEDRYAGFFIKRHNGGDSLEPDVNRTIEVVGNIHEPLRL